MLLTAVLLVGATTALAAEDARAWDAHNAFVALKPMSNDAVRRQGNFYVLLGQFYLDFDNDGVPELVTRHGRESFSPSYHMEEDECVAVWRYNGASAEKVTGYPASAQWDGDTADTLYTSMGASGGTFGAIVAFGDGTYGLRSRTSNHGYSQERTSALVNGKFQPTTKAGTEVFQLGSKNSFPADRIFPTPAKPEEPKLIAQERYYPMVFFDGTTWIPKRLTTYAVLEGNGETNYVRVRDLALQMKDSTAPFEVVWDGAVNLLPGEPYTVVGSEMDQPFSGAMAYTVPTEPTLVNGEKTPLECILIQDAAGRGYTYYKLRDLADVLGYKVDVDYIPFTIRVSAPSKS